MLEIIPNTPVQYISGVLDTPITSVDALSYKLYPYTKTVKQDFNYERNRAEEPKIRSIAFYLNTELVKYALIPPLTTNRSKYQVELTSENIQVEQDYIARRHFLVPNPLYISYSLVTGLSVITTASTDVSIFTQWTLIKPGKVIEFVTSDLVANVFLFDEPINIEYITLIGGDKLFGLVGTLAPEECLIDITHRLLNNASGRNREI